MPVPYHLISLAAAGRVAVRVLLCLCLSFPAFAQVPSPVISNLRVASVSYHSNHEYIIDTLRVTFEVTHPEQVSGIKIYFGNISPNRCQTEDVAAELWYNHRVARYVLSNFEEFEKSVYATMSGKSLSVPICFREMRLRWKEVNYVLVVVTNKQGRTSYQYYKNSKELMERYCR